MSPGTTTGPATTTGPGATTGPETPTNPGPPTSSRPAQTEPTVGCPSDAAILAAARSGNGGSLPSAAAVSDRDCFGSYVAAELSSDAGPASILLTRNGGVLSFVVLGTYLCDNARVRGAPAAIRSFLHCT